MSDRETFLAHARSLLWRGWSTSSEEIGSAAVATLMGLGMLVPEGGAAELERLRARVAELETERHTTNEALSDAAERLRRDRDRIAELEALKPASIQTCRKCGAGYTLGQPCSTCQFKAEMAAATAVRGCGCPARFDRHAWGCPTLPDEAPHEGPEHHTYRVGRDLPEYPNA